MIHRFFQDTQKGKVSAKRRIRKNQILRILRDHEILSYTGIARKTKFSLPMVSELAKELLEEEYILPAQPGESRVGRPPTAVRLNPEAAYVLGIDLGRTYVNFVLINLHEDIVLTLSLPTGDIEDQPHVIKTMDTGIEQVVMESRIPAEKLLGIGVAIPGLVNHETGYSFTYLSENKQPVQRLLQEHFGHYVAIDNDVNAMALGEMRFGKAKDTQHAICINLGWGIGAGFILNGELYRGNSGFAGEFGHIIVKEDGDLCTCGKRGCLETVASGRAVSRMARAKLEGGAPSQLNKVLRGKIDQIDPESIIKYAQKGDQFSIDMIRNEAEYIGKGLSILINLLNPEIIILGGRGSEAREIILHPIQSSIQRYAHVNLQKEVKIVCSDLGYKAGSLGAASLITREIFEPSHLNPNNYV